MRAPSGAFRGSYFREMPGFPAAKGMGRRLYAFRRNRIKKTAQNYATGRTMIVSMAEECGLTVIPGTDSSKGDGPGECPPQIIAKLMLFPAK